MDTTGPMEAKAVGEMEEIKKEEQDPEPRMENCRQALVQARDRFEGQSKLIEELLEHKDQVLQECTTDDMLLAIGSESLVASDEGRQLAAAFMPVVGHRYGWTKIQEQTGCKREARQLENLGEVMLLTWRNSQDGEDEEYVTFQMMDMVYRALVSEDEEVSLDFFTMLEPIQLRHCMEDMEVIIWRMMLANLWRCLKSPYDHIRLHAVQMLDFFYPVVSNDDELTIRYMYKQHEELMALLRDHSVEVRIKTINLVLRVLSHYWVTLNADWINNCLKRLLDLAGDEEEEVRLAVLESWIMLIWCRQAVNANIQALPIIIRSGINDQVERIRVAAFKLLKAIEAHRYIHFWHGVSMEELLMCFAVEESEAVKSEMVEVILSTFKPTVVHPEEVLDRVSYLGKNTRLGAMSFHHIVVGDTLITVDQTFEHIKMLAVAVYKELKRLDQTDVTSVPMMSAERATDILIEPHHVTVVVDPADEDESDGAKKWRTCQILLECATVMWVVLRKRMLKEPELTEHKVERTRTETLLNNAFKGLFPVFKDTQMLAALCALGSTLEEDRESSEVVRQKLLSDELAVYSDQCRCYLELGASWDFLPILEFMHSGLEKLEAECLPANKPKVEAECLPANKPKVEAECPPTKKPKLNKAIEGTCSAERGLRYLKLILLSPEMKQNLSANHGFFIEMFHKDLKCMTRMLEALMSEKAVPFEERCPDLDVVLVAFEYVHVVLILLIKAKNCVSNKLEFKTLVEEDATWFTHAILPNITSSTDALQKAFIGKLVQVELRMISCHLQSHHNLFVYKEAVLGVLSFLTTNKPSVEFIVPVLKTLNILITKLYIWCYEKLTKDKAIPMTHTILAWMGERCSDEDFPMMKTAEEYVKTLDALMTEQKCLMKKSVVDEYAKLVLANTLPALVEHNKKEQNVMDPRAQVFKTPHVVSLFVGEIITKNTTILKATQSMLLTTVTNKSFVERFQGTDVLYAYGAVMQVVVYLHKKLKGMHVNTKACTDKVREQLAQLDPNVKTHDLYKKIVVLLDFSKLPQE